MMGHTPTSSPQTSLKTLQNGIAGTDIAVRNWRSFFRQPPALLRGLSFFAPVAAAYASFQAVLSSLPPSLSYANMHYLLAVASGFAAGALIGCGMLLVYRMQPEPAEKVAAGSVGRPSGGRTVGSSVISIPAVTRSCYEALLANIVSFDDPQLGRLTGWPHFFHEAAAGHRPTAFGTAYGLKLTVALGSQDGRLDRAALAETLWKLRRSDGGWASRTQGAVGRPEATAVTLGALTTAGCDSARIAEAGDVFETMVAPEGADTTGMASTFVVASVIRELVRIRPHSPRVAQLRAILLNGTIEDPRYDNLSCWSVRLDQSRPKVPSTAHTALAVVALARLRQVTGDDNQLRLTLEQAAHWLTLDTNLESQTEQIRRFVTADHWESLTVSLFTAAWVARALMAAPAEIPGSSQRLSSAIKVIINSQNGGIWEWSDGNRPLWMTYQGFSTLQAFALSRGAVL